MTQLPTSRSVAKGNKINTSKRSLHAHAYCNPRPKSEAMETTEPLTKDGQVRKMPHQNILYAVLNKLVQIFKLKIYAFNFKLAFLSFL